LGIIQGIAEWLPVSSTGHLRLAEHFLGLTLPIVFDVALHIGTLVVIFIFFRQDIKNILTALVHLDFKTEYGRMIPLIIVGSIPTALIGLAFSTQIEATFTSVLPIAGTLIISGILLYMSKLAREKTERITYAHALIFGVAQGIAIVPGISRSGTTIAVALLLGLSKTKAFRFSFLLSVPAVAGALGLTLYREHALLAQTEFGLPEVTVGAAIAMVVGYFALSFLKRIIENRKFHLFAYYCFAAGSILMVLGFSGY